MSCKEKELKKLMAMGALVAAVSVLTGCSSLDRTKEESLNQAAGIEVTETPQGVGVRLPEKVLFDFDKATLRADSGPAIARSAVLIKRSKKPVLVEGHTDNIGERDYNMKLSQARAEVVARALADKGVPASRINYKGFAFDRPVASNDTDEGRARNRRTEIVIIGESVDTVMGK